MHLTLKFTKTEKMNQSILGGKKAKGDAYQSSCVTWYFPPAGFPVDGLLGAKGRGGKWHHYPAAFYLQI